MELGWLHGGTVLPWYLLAPPTGEPCYYLKITVIQCSCGNKCNNYRYYDTSH